MSNSELSTDDGLGGSRDLLGHGDDHGELRSLIDAIAAQLTDADRARNATLGELLAGSKITLAYPDEYLEILAEKLMKANIAHLPVVSRDEEKLVGYVGWKDLMRVRLKLRAEERDRSSSLSGVFRKKKAAKAEA